MTCQNCIDECKICMEPIPSDLFQFLPCTHKLCKFCFQMMTKMECPFCRYDFSNEISEEDEPDFFQDNLPEEPYTRSQRKKRKKRKKQLFEFYKNNTDTILSTTSRYTILENNLNV
mgnify:CR=1 FL=1